MILMEAPLARLCVLGLLVLTLSVGAFAQSQATTGNIEGRVLDPQGAAVPGITVTATNQETGYAKNGNADDEGNYRLILLPPGKYRVTTSGSQGFAAATYENVIVTIGGQAPLDIQLSLSGTNVTIDVASEGQIVETARTSVSSTVNERAIENLPVNGRNFLDFATLTPGVIRDPTRGGDLSVGGQKGTLNSLQVDGVDNNNTFFGQSLGRTGTRPPYQFSEEAVQEFQVNQNGFSAEFGRAGGAVINVVTKSGTNKFHGGAFEYFRDESLNSNTPQLTARGAKRPKSQINQFGGRIGGPIVKDRAFFFFTYDGQRSNLPNAIDLLNLSAQPLAVQNLLLPRLNTYQVGRIQDVYLVKGDITLNSSNQLSLRFNRQNFTGTNNENSGAFSAEEHSGNSVARTTTFSGTLASTLSQRLVNEFRFQFAQDAEPGEANSSQPETIVRTGVGTLSYSLGRNNFSPRDTTIKRAQFIDNVSYVTGRHNIKTGIDLNFDRILNFFPGLFSGSYTFPSYTAFLNNQPSAFIQNFPGAGTTGATTKPNSTDYAFYVQDDWRATPALTLNIGLRYDYQGLACPQIQNPDPALLAAGFDTSRCPKDKNNFAPRLGFSYAFDERTVVRGGYGIYYARTPAIMLGTAHSQNGIQVTGVNLTSAAQIAAAGLTYPNVLSGPPAAGAGAPVRPNLYLFAAGYEQPYVHQARLGIEREVLPNLSLSVTYLLYRGSHLGRTRDVNLFEPVPTTATDPTGQTFTILRFPGTGSSPSRPLNNYNRISLFDDNTRSLYNGLAVQATRRFSNNFQFIAAYTFSKVKDDKPDQVSVVVPFDDFRVAENTLDPQSDYATADTDVPHRFVFSPVFEVGRFTRSDNPVLRGLLSDYNFSTIVQLQSGFTYSAAVGGDPNRNGNFSTDRAPGTARNQFRTPNIYQVDARLTKIIRFGESVRLRLIVEGFNIFNRSNVSSATNGFYAGNPTVNPDGTLRLPAQSSSFGTARAFLGERQVQLAVKFDF
ncbi:MAG: TonB-dependent receptor [Pyrinomonadaceae bacterium]